MPSYVRVKRAVAALVLASAAACDSGGPITEPGPVPVAAVTVSSSAASLVVGESGTAAATLKDAAGNPLTGRVVTWTASPQTVATVSAAGGITAIAPGTVRIGATSEGRRGEIEITVLPRTSLVAAVTLDAATLVLGSGETRQLTATPRDAAGAPVAGVTVTWALEGDAAAATVSAGGLVTAREMGVATVSAGVNGKRAQATVTVLGTATHDLVFDQAYELGPFGHQALHRLDMRTPGAVPVNVLQLTSSSDAAPSPDGTRIAFTCPNSGPVICVANRDGGNVTVLPGFSDHAGLLGDQPAWSPDGSKIAFRGWMPGGSPGLVNPTDVWVMNADGSGMARLTAGAAGVDYYESPTWSPRQADGSYRLAFSHATRGGDGFVRAAIASVRADGQDRLPVTAPGEYADAEPAWSPDGSTIAFVRTGGTAGGDVWLVNAGGGGERPLMAAAVEPPGAQRAPAWSPDGGQVAFVSNHEIIGTYYAWQLYTVRADGTRLARRTDDRADKGHPAWIRRP